MEILAIPTGGDPATAGDVVAAVGGGVGGLVATAGAILGARSAARARHERGASLEQASHALAEANSPERVYIDLIRASEKRGNRAFLACLATGLLGAGTVIGGAAAGFLFGMPDVGIFTAVCGAMPSAVAGLLGRMAKDANADAKEYFQHLADSHERDNEIDRKLKVAKQLKDPGDRARYLMDLTREEEIEAEASRAQLREKVDQLEQVTRLKDREIQLLRHNMDLAREEAALAQSALKYSMENQRSSAVPTDLPEHDDREDVSVRPPESPRAPRRSRREIPPYGSQFGR